MALRMADLPAMAFVSFLLTRGLATGSLHEGVVLLPNGVKLRGEQFQEGGPRVYYGIKYGIAGRFEHAKPNTDFSYLEDPNRVKGGHVCPQFQMKFSAGSPSRNLNMSEDCLYLDVYVPPSEEKKSDPRPVLFWIYGGGFKAGDKDLYNATVLAKAVDAIVVTVNYRTSAFGFLSTGDEVAPGNWAIGDLKLALNWTIHNVAAFGGDPTKITIFGESSGGVLTSALLLDENVSRKVKAGIAFSGSTLAGWAMMKSPKAGTLMLAGNLGCPNSTSAEAVSCLKALPYEAVLNGTLSLEKRTDLATLTMYYALVVDGVHLTKLPEDILRARAGAADKLSEKKRANIVSGYLREDAAIYTLLSAPQLLSPSFTHTYSSTLNMLTMWTVAHTNGRCPPAQAALKAKAAFDFYDISASVSSDDALSAYHRVTTDLMFGVYALKESMLYANISDNRNQMFLISYDPGFQRMGAFHCSEIFHLFQGSCDDFLKAKANAAVSRTLQDYVRQIAYTGRYEGPYFGREGNYHELTRDAKFVNKKADFSAKVRLLEDMLNCGSATG